MFWDQTQVLRIVRQALHWLSHLPSSERNILRKWKHQATFHPLRARGYIHINARIHDLISLSVSGLLAAGVAITGEGTALGGYGPVAQTLQESRQYPPIDC